MKFDFFVPEKQRRAEEATLIIGVRLKGCQQRTGQRPGSAAKESEGTRAWEADECMEWSGGAK